MLQYAGLRAGIHLWFMLEGAPLFFFFACIAEILNLFPEQWMGRGGLRAWSASSSHLSQFISLQISKFCLFEWNTFPRCQLSDQTQHTNMAQ